MLIRKPRCSNWTQWNGWIQLYYFNPLFNKPAINSLYSVPLVTSSLFTQEDIYDNQLIKCEKVIRSMSKQSWWDELVQRYIQETSMYLYSIQYSVIINCSRKKCENIQNYQTPLTAICGSQNNNYYLIIIPTSMYCILYYDINTLALSDYNYQNSRYFVVSLLFKFLKHSRVRWQLLS